MRYSPRCMKVAYNSETEAWEYVIHYRRENKSWTMPYLCRCGKYHTTGKHFDIDKVPQWVKQSANDKQRYKRTMPDMTLPLHKQKELIAHVANKNRQRGIAQLGKFLKMLWPWKK